MTGIESYVIDRVRKMRLEKEWSIQALADNINVSKSFVADVENPKRRSKYNLNHINEIAKAFECSIHDLLPSEPV
jgi:transcriptional regulator with XRE-family HTH domain